MTRRVLDTGLARGAVVLAVLALVGTLHVARRTRRARGYAPPVPALRAEDVPGGLGAPLTIVYFTSRLCAACADTPRVAADAAPEVRAVPVSVHERPDLARALALTETPTLLLVDARGRIRFARAGNPEPAELWTYVREAWDSLEAEGALCRREAGSAAHVGPAR